MVPLCPALMKVEWSPKLLKSGIISSAHVVIQGTDVFKGLRVRMGAHMGEANVEKASQLSQSRVLKNVRSISNIAMGGQILLSNDMMVEAHDTLRHSADIAALGLLGEGETEEGDTTLSVVQLLPRGLSKRLPEFIATYEGKETEIRPPVGKITCVFTSCPALKKLGKGHSDLGNRVSEMVDSIITLSTDESNGYICKGQGGKFLIMFSVTDDAVKWAVTIQQKLMQVVWPEGTGDAKHKSQQVSLALEPPLHSSPSHLPPLVPVSQDVEARGVVFGNIELGVGIDTGVPSMFSFNKITKRMDYFGKVINRAARVTSCAIAGEICVTEQVQGEISKAFVVNLHIESRGLFTLKGIATQQEIFTLQSVELKGRIAALNSMRQEESSMLSTSFSPIGISAGSDEPNDAN